MFIPRIISLPQNRVFRTYLGGKTLDTLSGETTPMDSQFPEDWVASTTCAANKGREHLVDEGISRVNIAGRELLLTELFEQFPEAMLGKEHYERFGAQTQVLLKLLDSSIRLHIQCHPSIKFARTRCGSNSGKTEAYVILGAREEVRNPYIYLGFQHSPERADFRRAILEQDIPAITACFDKVPVKPGDVFIVPGGIPHAIGEGVFMVEIMEPTDLAVRLEFERGGVVLPEASRFMNRDVEFALDMLNFDEFPLERVRRELQCEPKLVRSYGDNGAEYSLIDERHTPCFSVSKLEVKGVIEHRKASFYIGIVASGNGCIRVGDDELHLHPGSKFLVPAASGAACFESINGMDIICTYPPYA